MTGSEKIQNTAEANATSLGRQVRETFRKASDIPRLPQFRAASRRPNLIEPASASTEIPDSAATARHLTSMLLSALCCMAIH